MQGFHGLSLLANVCGGFLAIFLGAFGILAIIQSYHSQQKVRKSKSWPEIKGTITQSDVAVKEENKKHRFIPQIHYTYEVDGISYESTQISFSSIEEFPTIQKAAEHLAHFPLDNAVDVYYNPDNPTEAVLVRAAREFSRSLLIGIVLLDFTICLVCLLGFQIYSLLTG